MGGVTWAVETGQEEEHTDHIVEQFHSVVSDRLQRQLGIPFSFNIKVCGCVGEKQTYELPTN